MHALVNKKGLPGKHTVAETVHRISAGEDLRREESCTQAGRHRGVLPRAGLPGHCLPPWGLSHSPPVRVGDSGKPAARNTTRGEKNELCVLGEFIFLLKAGWSSRCVLLQLCRHEGRILRHRYFQQPVVPPPTPTTSFGFTVVLQPHHGDVVRFS